MGIELTKVLNVNSLVIEEPPQKQVLPFDPNRDITEEDFEIWETFREAEERTGAYLKIATGKSAADLNITEPDWPELRHRLKEAFWGNTRSTEYVRLVAEYNTLFPGAKKYLITTNRKEQKYFLDLSKSNYLRWVDAFTMVGLFANEETPAQLVEADEELKQDMLRACLKHKDAGDETTEQLEVAANIKLIFPETAYEEMGVDAEFWQKLRTYLEKCRQTAEVSDFFGAEPYFRYLRNAAVLSASKITIDGEGIQLFHNLRQMPEKSMQLPHERSF